MPADDHARENAKNEQLETFREDPDGSALTTNHGVKVSDTDNSLKAGVRGPTLMEDFHFREKLTHFDHERIPERIVHARGSAAHGYFECYEDFSELTRAAFLRDPSVRTPVFVRFSTVVGFRGSADTVRDVRGFATEFYTEEGNFDLVGNNMPVFFIQDAIKFPDLVHSIKPQPHHEMPQASAAHDNFWDFISLTPESLHQIMWVLSDRALPRSYRMMEGFGVHTFRLVDETGNGRFIKWHWRPKLGTHSLVWDEAQKIAGKDPDFNRRDLWEAIEKGDFPEYELGVQVVEEEDEHRFDFDLLDPTKIIPEELVPIRPLGRMVLDRNPDNFFAETEQAAFHPGHVVPGIDFTNDPLLQGRLFSYLDTQLIRLGGPNFNEIPINRPVAPVHNNQRDGFHRQTINKGRTNYSPNTRGGGCPMTAGAMAGGYVHYAEKVEGQKVRERSPSFGDHHSQAAMFWNSLSEVEKAHLVEAAHFELGKVDDMAIRERMVEHFSRIDPQLGARVGAGIGVEISAAGAPAATTSSPVLSMERPENPRSASTRKVAILVADGFDADEVETMKEALKAAGAEGMVVTGSGGQVKSANGKGIKPDKTFLTSASVLFDGVYIPGGSGHVQLLSQMGKARHFVSEAYRHYKPIAATGEGTDLLALIIPGFASPEDGGIRAEAGVVCSGPLRQGLKDRITDTVGSAQHADPDDLTSAFIAALAQHRHWDRPMAEQISA